MYECTVRSLERGGFHVLTTTLMVLFWSRHGCGDPPHVRSYVFSSHTFFTPVYVFGSGCTSWGQTRFFSPSCCFCCACLIFYREKGAAVRSLVDSVVDFLYSRNYALHEKTKFVRLCRGSNSRPFLLIFPTEPPARPVFSTSSHDEYEEEHDKNTSIYFFISRDKSSLQMSPRIKWTFQMVFSRKKLLP